MGTTPGLRRRRPGGRDDRAGRHELVYVSCRRIRPRGRRPSAEAWRSATPGTARSSTSAWPRSATRTTRKRTPASPRPSSRTATASARTSAASARAPPARRLRRHLRRRRRRRRARRPELRSVRAGGNGRSDVRVHLVIPKSFNDAQQVADKFKDAIPVILNLQGIDDRPLQAPDRLRQRADLRARRRHAADRRQGVHAHAAQRRDLGGGARAADREGLLQPVLGCTPSARSGSSAPGTWPARSRAAGVGPCSAPTSCAGRAQALVDELGGEALAVQRRARPARRRRRARATSPPAATPSRPRSPAHAKASSRSSAATPLADVKAAYPDRPGLPHPAHDAGRGAPGRGHPRRRRRAGPPSSTRPSARCSSALGHARRARRRAGRRRDGPDEQRAGLRRAGRRGADRRRRAPRADRRPGRASWSSRRWPGTAALLRARGDDTLAVRREVTSPGGSTARGLAALERGGLRAAFPDALEAVLEAR